MALINRGTSAGGERFGWEAPHEDELRSFRHLVLDWFEENQRDLPWRNTRDPYRVLVSEVMLQQTQVSRVLPKYTEFIEHFPSVAALGAASTGEVLRAWKGLGYNRRAMYLRQTAEAIQLEYRGIFPERISDLERLPGIGRYTARAIACFAFEAHVAIVETNVRRAIDWFVDPALKTALPQAALEHLAMRLLPPNVAWQWNQAMIDFGALYVPTRPRNSDRPRPAQRFEDTDRFWRGRIVDVLRVAEGALPFEAMLEQLPYRPDERRVRKLLTALSDEGLVRYDVASGRAALDR